MLTVSGVTVTFTTFIAQNPVIMAVQDYQFDYFSVSCVLYVCIPVIVPR